MMRAFKSEDTAPEIAVRRLVYALGYRYRLHRKDLPGSPDVVFAPRMRLIFIHGCFWHFHGCSLTRVPKNNVGYWLPKLERNRARDARNVDALREAGWSCLVIWECEIQSEKELRKRLGQFLR